MKDNYAFYLNSNLEKYIGEWIAVVDSKIIAHGQNAKQVYGEAKKLEPHKIPFLACVPQPTAMIL